MDEETEELEKNIRERASRQELFEKKVGWIGELHTRRALLANRIGRMKSESMMRHDDVEHEARKEAGVLEEEMAGISKSITDFRPDSLGDLESFRKETHDRFDAVEKKIAAAEEKTS
ncbi:MAG: hypothetical protein ACLFRP_08045 [Puniceicoccaceae bacterium]